MTHLLQLLTLVFLLGPESTISETEITPLKGVLGESVTLPLELPADEETLSITWLHNGSSITFIQPKETQIQVTDPRRKDRLSITASYSLQIKDLRMADAGLYRAQKTTTNFSVFSSYHLRIFRRLRNLQVANYTQLSENGTCEMHLACSVENPDDHVAFRWQVSGDTLREEANLTVSWDPKSSREQTFTCRAENPVSNLSFSFSVHSLCKGVFKEKNEHLKIIWILLVVLSVAAIAACLFVWRKKLAGSLSFSPRQTQSPAETLRSPDYGPFPAGSTVYAQVTHPNTRTESTTPMKNNDCPTIYSTIYQPKKGNCPSQCHLSC